MILSTVRFLVILTVVLTGSAVAQVRQWTRMNIESAEVSFERPSSWISADADAGAEILLREHPYRGNHQGGLSISVRRSTSMDERVEFARDEDFPVRFPGATIVREFEPAACRVPVHVFHVTGLRQPSGYDLLDGMAHLQKKVIYFSLYCEKGKASRYEPILVHMLRSLDGESTPGANSTNEGQRDSSPPGRDQIDWVYSLDAALEIARSRGVPLMISIVKDENEASELMMKGHYHNRGIVSLSRDLVCLVASPDSHGNGGVQEICDSFGRIFCADHQATEIQVRTKYLRSASANVPQHLFCSSDGRLLARRERNLSRTELSNLMRDAVREVDRIAAAERSGAPRSFADEYLRASDPFVKQWMIADALESDRFDDVAGLLEEAASRADADLLTGVLDGLGFSGDVRGADLAAPLLDHAIVAVRNHAVVALEQIGDPATLSGLQARLHIERSSKVKKNLLRALGACAHGDVPTRDVLLNHAQSGAALYRINAILSLMHFDDDPSVGASMNLLLEKERNHEVMAAAAWTLSVLGETSSTLLIEKAQRRAKKVTAKRIFIAALDRLHARPSIANERSLIAKLARDEIQRRD